MKEGQIDLTLATIDVTWATSKRIESELRLLRMQVNHSMEDLGCENEQGINEVWEDADLKVANALKAVETASQYLDHLYSTVDERN